MSDDSYLAWLEITVLSSTTFHLGTWVLSAWLFTRNEKLFAFMISHCAVFGYSVWLFSSVEAAKWVGITLTKAFKVCLMLLDSIFKNIFWNQGWYQ